MRENAVGHGVDHLTMHNGHSLVYAAAVRRILFVLWVPVPYTRTCTGTPYRAYIRTAVPYQY
eukprot:COSAG05_NODE_956_length_6433_cov_1.774708_5_plen_62_part_00